MAHWPFGVFFVIKFVCQSPSIWCTFILINIINNISLSHSILQNLSDFCPVKSVTKYWLKINQDIFFWKWLSYKQSFILIKVFKELKICYSISSLEVFEDLKTQEITILLTNIFLFLNQYIELKMRIHYNQYLYLQNEMHALTIFLPTEKVWCESHNSFVFRLSQHPKNWTLQGKRL